MKVRESGMLEAGIWQGFFRAEAVLDAMQLTGEVRDAADFGCGYGTFAVPAAKRILGTLHAFDTDPAMIEATRHYAGIQRIVNLRLYLRDFVSEGTGLTPASVDYVMLFNILHAENPAPLLLEAYRILAPGGHLAAIHWNYDPQTPRGPPMSMRPKPEDCRRWIEEAGLVIHEAHINLPPHHYGILATKSRT